MINAFPLPCDEWLSNNYVDGYGKRQYKGKWWKAHRAEWDEKRGPIPLGMKVLHHCDNRPCREITHLFLGTDADNVADMVSKDRQAKGETHSQSKMTEDKVRELRTLRKSGWSLADLADLYEIGKSQVSHIARKKGWPHVD